MYNVSLSTISETKVIKVSNPYLLYINVHNVKQCIEKKRKVLSTSAFLQTSYPNECKVFYHYSIKRRYLDTL